MTLTLILHHVAMNCFNVADQRLLSEKDDTTDATFEALSDSRRSGQLVSFLNVAGNLCFSVAFVIAIVALECKMSSMLPLHVSQPSTFKGKWNNALFTLILFVFPLVRSFLMVFVHVVCNCLHRIAYSLTIGA